MGPSSSTSASCNSSNRAQAATDTFFAQLYNVEMACVSFIWLLATAPTERVTHLQAALVQECIWPSCTTGAGVEQLASARDFNVAIGFVSQPASGTAKDDKQHWLNSRVATGSVSHI